MTSSRLQRCIAGIVAFFTLAQAADLDPIVIKVRACDTTLSPFLCALLTIAIQGSKFFYKTNGTEL